MSDNQQHRIQDDLGYWWSYSAARGKIYLEAADLEAIEDGEDPEENGYYVDSFEDGVRYLKEEGYITDPLVEWDLSMYLKCC